MKKTRTERLLPQADFDPNICSGTVAIRNMTASAEWLKANREAQIRAGIEDYGNAMRRGEKSFLTGRTPLQMLRRRIEDAAHTIRSWHAWGDGPSPYGKAVCLRLREEIICLATIKRALTAQGVRKAGAK